MERDELSAWLRLQLTPGVGNASGRKLLARFGLPQQIFDQSIGSLEACVSAKQAQSLQLLPSELAALLQTTWDWLEQNRQTRHVLTLGDPCYPAALLDTEDPPLLLYAMGEAHHVQQGWDRSASTTIAVVGSRNPTAQGVANARQFSEILAQAGLTVVSGLALGIDGAAHEGALDGAPPGQLATIAVVGTGLDRVYPKAHFQLAHQIAQNGLLISEYPLGTPPLSANFPKRNRIISGLSHATLVVEAALQSGSLITARLAVEQGKDVFAIPGSIHATQARGCHALIKQGAKLVESAQDILEEFSLPTLIDGIKDPETQCPGALASDSFSANEHALLTAMAFESAGLDALQARTGLDTPTLQALLMGLELQGLVARLPGGLFQRLARG
ncbi:MAG: DNA-protecting protein DprA [Curvibacter sp.]|nr:MAG: DNA-protecting protein DprA [Curvibacter sp.]